MICPCCSGLTYEMCCQPFHLGAEPPTALQLMRSRYSAYATENALYIQKTTHPKKSPHYNPDKARWRQEIDHFCRTTQFVKLEIVDFGENWVSFKAHLIQEGKPLLLQEKSFFEKVGPHWRYTNGEVSITHPS
jgi:SEC-C motif domain protein